VNVADERLVMYRENWPVFSTRVIVGQDDRLKQSPELQATIDGIWFNPPWNVPQDIAASEILAALLMQQPIDAINQTIATDRTTRSNLPKPVPIFVVYETAFAGVDGKLEFRADVYGRDGEIGPYLNPERRAVVERGAPYRPGG